VYLLFYSPQSWENLLEGSLTGLFPITRIHSNYSIELEDKIYFNGFLPEGIEFVTVDHGLLAGNLEYVDDLKDEMCSERPSVEDFLQKSFGLVPIHDRKIIGWCLSEYNTTEACEIGIAIRPEYQRQGLATSITLAFLDLARQNGLKRVGWNCWKDNIPSAKTAVKAGFHHVRDHPVLFGFFDPTIQLGVHGNLAFDREHYPVALSWYEKAIQRGDAPGWLLWNAIRAATWTGKEERAIELVEIGLVQGKLEMENITSSEDIASLREQPAWRW
jgi:GNAT superfamily N-acetyltransferase